MDLPQEVFYPSHRRHEQVFDVSPIRTIDLRSLEDRVSDKCRSKNLDPGNAESADEIFEVIRQEVVTNRSESVSSVAANSAEKIFRSICGLGPIDAAMRDPQVWEIIINAPDAIFVRRHSKSTERLSESFYDDDHLNRTVSRLLERSIGSRRKLDPVAGLQDAQLPDGSRVHIVHPELTKSAHLCVNIRKFTGLPNRSLSQLVSKAMLSSQTATLLTAAIRSKATMIFAGPPGAGKTTLLGCLASELDPSSRVVIAEEVPETEIQMCNVAHLQSRPERQDRPEIDLRRLVTGFLRMAPDIAIVGEVRDRESLPFLLTTSSGVQGMTTIHASSARQALTRLCVMSQLNGINLASQALCALVSDAVDMVIYVQRINSIPKITEIVAIEDPQTKDSSGFTTTPMVKLKPQDDFAYSCGPVPHRLRTKLADHGYDLGELLKDCSELSTAAI